METEEKYPGRGWSLFKKKSRKDRPKFCFQVSFLIRIFLFGQGFFGKKMRLSEEGEVLI